MHAVLKNVISAKTMIFVGFFVVLGILLGYWRNVEKVTVLIDLNDQYRENISQYIKNNPDLLIDNEEPSKIDDLHSNFKIKDKIDSMIDSLKQDNTSGIDSDKINIEKTKTENMDSSKKSDAPKVDNNILDKKSDVGKDVPNILENQKLQQPPFISSLLESKDIPSSNQITSEVIDKKIQEKLAKYHKNHEEKGVWQRIKSFFKPTDEVEKKDKNSINKTKNTDMKDSKKQLNKEQDVSGDIAEEDLGLDSIDTDLTKEIPSTQNKTVKKVAQNNSISNRQYKSTNKVDKKNIVIPDFNPDDLFLESLT